MLSPPPYNAVLLTKRESEISEVASSGSDIKERLHFVTIETPPPVLSKAVLCRKVVLKICSVRIEKSAATNTPPPPPPPLLYCQKALFDVKVDFKIVVIYFFCTVE